MKLQQVESSPMAPLYNEFLPANGLTSKSEPVHPSKPKYKVDIVWRNVALFSVLHVATLQGAYILLFKSYWVTWVWCYLIWLTSGLGITAGAHRLWAHKTYKAKLPLRIVLALWNAMALQNDVYEWSRDHRAHHKFSETDADPHNSKRGFFFAHIGWLLCKKHPDVKTKGKTVDLSDLEADPVIIWQRKYYIPLVLVLRFLYPMATAHYFLGESWWNGFFACSIFPYTVLLHCTWFVNSAAHLWGDQPYDKDIHAFECVTAIVASSGEGFHNYHHTYPWDYRASEFGRLFSITTAAIDIWAWMGLAYDLKVAPQEVINRRKALKGDKSIPPWELRRRATATR